MGSQRHEMVLKWRSAFKLPPTPEIEPFRTFTQDNVLNEQTEKILPEETWPSRG